MRNPYQLTFPTRFQLAPSVHSFQLEEALDSPYHLSVAVTLPERDLPLAPLIGQPVTFTLTPQATAPPLAIPGLAPLVSELAGLRSWHGVIRHGARGRSTREETLYTFDIGPRLALLQDSRTTRLFQNMTVAQVIEALLRKHGLDGSDFRFNLTGAQASYEHLTQFRETDLAFLTRLAAHVGIFYQFAQSGDGKEVIRFGNDLEHYSRGLLLNIPLHEQAGLESVGTEAVTAFSIRHSPMLHSTRRRNFNDMAASQLPDGSAGFAGEVPAAHGEDYDWGDDNRDDAESIQLAQMRHQLSLSRQCCASGDSNVSLLRPGEVLKLDHAFADAPHGWLISAVTHSGSRDSAYRNSFHAIPADRVWRPALPPKPRIHGTLPAMVVSPGNNSYQYPFLDEHGRYRVRFLFDLDSWSPGGDSRAVRLAKPFAGRQFGFHMPIHPGTIVHLAFSDGDPDQPYIAAISHDSERPDPITSQWHSRNVIRTKANNKLRMEDLQGKEHIKLASEYGKSQLNIGHLVDAARAPRGEGFEIRTDHWGAIRAGKGLLISAEANAVATTAQLDMAAALHQLEQANRLAKALADAATTATALPPDVQAQVDLLQQSLKQLAQAGILISAPAGIGLTTPHTIQQSAGATYAVTAGQHISHAALGDIRSNANGAISLFARSGGVRLFANQGSVDIQAQGGPLAVSAAKILRLHSNQHISVAGHDSIELAAGGHGIRISAKGVEVFGDIKLHGTLSNEGKAGLEHEDDSFPQTDLLPNKGLSL
ncbi:type VI secretion system Vgr family protein [Aquitalea sp. LB_tupeE]|uniref:type VI secretion system Vgr family protein n=2 Tax=unclassified Aquitalea TaxID=2628611 RepID=UPI0015BA3069|nr:type VI secretion system Vgr family protein [Aquitalea sp. LB_tupeE]NWK80086.1 type VI secretion system tip protein VgrG [Aquitalea sp. LB_tupeE]